MELTEALDIVSYKIGLRFGETALGDELFLDEVIHESILDKAAGTEREIDLKVYMQATQIVSAERSRLFKVKNADFITENAQKEGVITTESGERGEPATFAVKKVITGWTEALQLMQVGDKFQLFIPQEIGYGKPGMGSDIPPFATLIFDVELLDIVS